MSKFVLRPAKVVQSRLLAQEAEPEEHYTIEELVRKLGASGSRFEQEKIALLRPGCYVGLSRKARSEGSVVFVLGANNGPGDLSAALKRDPTVAERIFRAYRVERVLRETSRVAEPDGPLDAELDK